MALRSMLCHFSGAHHRHSPSPHSTMSTPRGLPLLSGVPPEPAGHELSCRKCNKEFNILFARSKRCNHCGYSYCSSCAGYTALMPRENSGYDPVSVCTFCIENLTITAGSRNHLKTLSLGKLKKYADAYNLRSDQVIEKDELVDRLMSYRRGNGCLPPENEDFYRKHSVPNLSTPRPRGLFSRQAPPPPPPAPTHTYRSQRPQSHFPRPDVQSQWQPPPPRSPRPTSMPQTPSQPQYSTRPQPSQQPTNPFSRPQQPTLNIPRPNQSTRPRATSHGATTPPPPPTLDQLLTMAPEDIRSLPVAVLKEILFHNHVNARLPIEKSDLVERVTTLVADERQDRERQEIFRQMEEEQERHRRAEMEAEPHAEPLNELRLDSERQTPDVSPEPGPETDSGHGPSDVDPNDTSQQKLTASTDDATSPGKQTTANTPTPPQPMSGANSRPAMAMNLERNGLCVICQDEEANIAIVDCGHMAMCRGCSDHIMSSTRECPLCRTHIVTEARLLRIFKA
ncbi:hypothetical protein BJ322DRAFT_1046120 [Thelephora terrestris]|uniref:RING-type domain-containing protein n=1 Tax=Thelephora terrestris TaxID=56493 RepID=A0A9P6HIM2_9AGAM|nr:hypothetical protein BJ322DRAFT_1046120 [Thelephora terrestris]